MTFYVDDSQIPVTAAALLTIAAEDLHQPRLPADGTRLRLRSLMAMGHGYARLARAAGTSPADIRKIINGRAAEVTPQLHDRVRRVWEAWWDKTPPARTAAQAAAATKARARRGGWCNPPRPGRRPHRPRRLPARARLAARHRHRHRTRPGAVRAGQNRPAAEHKTSHTEEGNAMPFDPPARPANTRKEPHSGTRP
jgi:hypothetical protein